MEWNGQKARKAIESFAFGHEELIAAVEVFRNEMEKGFEFPKRNHQGFCTPA